jgi:hypothetical protein
MTKPAILKILLAIFITSTAIFGWMLFAQKKNNIPQPIHQVSSPLAMPYEGNDIIIGGKLATATDTRISKPSEYTKINSVYAEKDGAIYYAEPFKRHTNKPVYYKVEGADPDTFTIEDSFYPEWGFAYDKEHTFFGGKITDIDRQSFKRISGRYFRDKDFIYFVKNNTGSYSLLKLPYDVESFKIFATGGIENDYIIDKNGVWYNRKIIPGVDQGTLSLVSSPQELIMLQRGMKDGPPSLSGYYMRDANNIIYRGKIAIGADPRSFKVISTGPYFQEYGRDNKNVYYQNFIITGADPDTFKPLTYQVYEGCVPDKYGTDANGVYYKNTKIEGADPGTFKALFNGYGKDKNGVYLKGVLKESLDPQTFTSECDYG